jgi:hypothetical protein
VCSPDTVHGDSLYYGAGYRHATHLLRRFIPATDGNSVDRLAIALVDFVRLPTGRDTGRNAQLVFIQLQANSVEPLWANTWPCTIASSAGRISARMEMTDVCLIQLMRNTLLC